MQLLVHLQLNHWVERSGIRENSLGSWNSGESHTAELCFEDALVVSSNYFGFFFVILTLFAIFAGFLDEFSDFSALGIAFDKGADFPFVGAIFVIFFVGGFSSAFPFIGFAGEVGFVADFAAGLFAAGLFAAGLFAAGLFVADLFVAGLFAAGLFAAGLFVAGLVASGFLGSFDLASGNIASALPDLFTES